MAKEYKDLVVGLDIGTSKVMVVVAEVMPGGELKLAGLGIAPGNGLKRGVVVNIDATVQSIQQALKEAEFMADCKITRVNTGITGAHIRGLNSSGMVAVKDKEVTAADVARVMETARAINISTDQRLLLVAPQEFVIDSQDVKEPIGMSGMRLEAKVHIVTGAQSAAENIIKCVRRCGLEVEQLLLNPLSSSLAVLTEDERELGVACVDIGAGTTDVAIFTNGAIRHTAVIPVAGDLITSDIAMALRTPTKDAEDIKVESGYAKQLLADPESQVEVPGLGDRGPRMLSRQALAGVIEPRVEEIFSLVQQVIRESGYEEVLSSGIVLTGGSAVMPGMLELGEDIFLKPVRRGVPKYRGALADMVSQARAATVMGLLEEARMARLRGFKVQERKSSMNNAFGRFKDFIVGNF
ncbi:cell division protein FtsA [Limnohabitans sp. Rim8]|jgi:cell division protein FtsA|uniref:cell division protein FtsA n=1 Tax=Limnohabitans sp. Rim8 TaxID=1100718 RepID=UPI0026212E15|nr:cell division protein FtsA [Limnohabitans sp. Rim8]